MTAGYLTVRPRGTCADQPAAPTTSTGNQSGRSSMHPVVCFMGRSGLSSGMLCPPWASIPL